MQIEDDDKMAIQVRFLSENKIEGNAEAMLADYEETAGEPVKSPLPVADITTYRTSTVHGPRDLTPFFLRRV